MAVAQNHAEPLQHRVEEPPSPLLTTRDDSFPFFNLCPELIYMILRKFTSVEEKAIILRHIVQFQPYLRMPGIWLYSTSCLFLLARVFPPGWFQDEHYPHIFVYVSVDYDDLSLCLYIFKIKARYGKNAEKIQKLTQPFPKMYHLLVSFRTEHSLVPVQERDALIYNFYSCKTRRVLRLWVYVRQQKVQWTEDGNDHPLISNACHLHSRQENLELILQEEDRSLRVSFVCPRRGRREMAILPLRFEICLDKDASTFVEGETRRCACCPMFFSEFLPSSRIVIRANPTTNDFQLTEIHFEEEMESSSSEEDSDEIEWDEIEWDDSDEIDWDEIEGGDSDEENF